LPPASSGPTSAEPPELLASLLEFVVLVVARAGRAEQDDVPRLRIGRGVRNGALERLVVVACDDRPQPGGRLADQMDRAHVRPDRLGARPEVLAFQPAAE